MPESYQRQKGRSRGGVWKVLLSDARLVWQLMRDERVPWYLKLIPAAAVIYAVSPVDLMPLDPIDDAAVVSGAFYLFKALCPREVVAEYTGTVVSGEAENAQSGGNENERQGQ